MNSSSPTPEDIRADAEREELLAELHALLASRHVELQVRENRIAAVGEARAEWCRIRRKLEDQVVGAEELLDQLATMAYVGHSGHPLRVLLIGPPGAGKSHVAAALAAAVSTHTVTLDVTAVTEAGWTGMSLQEALAAAGPPKQLPGAALILEEIDKIRVYREAHGNARDKYRNQQSQWLSLLDRAGRVSLESGTIASGDVHVIITGAFSDAPWARRAGPAGVSREAMITYGLLAELVDRIDHVIVLTAPSARELAAILRREIERPSPTALELAVKDLGYEMCIHASVYGYVAQIVLLHRATAGTRVGRAMIEDAVQRALASALRRELPAGAVLRVTPDDVRLPSRPDDPPRRRGEDRGPGSRPVRRR